MSHTAITLEAEQALQAINPMISMPYWEYAEVRIILPACPLNDHVGKFFTSSLATRLCKNLQKIQMGSKKSSMSMIT